jgi:hypothetical protein
MQSWLTEKTIDRDLVLIIELRTMSAATLIIAPRLNICYFVTGEGRGKGRLRRYSCGS